MTQKKKLHDLIMPLNYGGQNIGEIVQEAAVGWSWLLYPGHRYR